MTRNRIKFRVCFFVHIYVHARQPNGLVLLYVVTCMYVNVDWLKSISQLRVESQMKHNVVYLLILFGILSGPK